MLSSGFLEIFDGRRDMLAKFCYKVIISKMTSIFASKRLGSKGLFIISNIYLKKMS